MGMAPVLDHNLPDAWVYLSVITEKYTKFSRSAWVRWKNRDEVPTPTRSSCLLSRCMLHTTSFAF